MSEEIYRIDGGAEEALVFRTLDDFAKWLRAEHQAWTWLWSDENGGYLGSAPPPVRSIYKALTNGVAQLEHEPEQAKAHLIT